MQFSSPSRRNPLANLLVGALLHGLALGAIVLGAFKALEAGSWLPLASAVVFVSSLEGLWLYFTLRARPTSRMADPSAGHPK
jgi:hypothetical protein